MSQDARHVINELIVELFQNILNLEEKYHRLHGIELSMTEIHTLDSIHQSETKHMSDVASRLNITQGTLTSTVKRLESKGYVKRVRDQQDRRVHRLQLLPAADAVLKVHHRFHDEVVNEILNEVEHDEKLVQAINNLNHFFKEIEKKES